MQTNTNKRIFLEVAIGAVAIWATFAFFGRGSDITNYPPKDGPVVFFGDSLVEGVGATSGNDLPALLSRMVSRNIVNLGVSGDTTVDGLARIDRALIDHKPSVLVVLLGGNDYLRKVPIDETFANLRTIIVRAQATGAITVVLGVRGGILGDPFADRYREVARETGSAYVPDVLDGLLGDNRYMDDAIHPNDQGYLRIAERVYPVLKKVIK